MTMIQIQCSEEIKCACPEFKGMALEATVTNTPYCEELWQEIAKFTEEYRARYTVDSIKEMPSIQATRTAYKRCGKDPSRYRPSGEALCRRLLRGLELYKVDTVVDLINLVSIASGYSIGGFDADKFEGNALTLGIGRAGEPYEGIGRGELNIEGMPVYRDAVGGVGTPTSDNERTKLSLSTTHLLAIVNGYDGDVAHLQETVDYMRALLEKYAGGCMFTEYKF
jgi:DNA/RNA-binding domain of Phe-tRNA-synthetase-like protein